MTGMFMKADQTCVEECPDATFDEDSQCKSCSDGCWNCHSLEVCIACDDDLFLDDGFCTESCGSAKYGDAHDSVCKDCIDNCNECHGETSCDRCMTDWFVSMDGQCVVATECGHNQYADEESGLCTVCDEACSTCTGGEATDCSACSGGYF